MGYDNNWTLLGQYDWLIEAIDKIADAKPRKLDVCYVASLITVFGFLSCDPMKGFCFIKNNIFIETFKRGHEVTRANLAYSDRT